MKELLIYTSIFILLRVTKTDEIEFYNILKESIDATSSDNFLYTDGMDGYPAPELIDDRPITIPINKLDISGKTLSSPYIIDTIFKLQSDNSSCLFKIIEKETTKLGICFIQVQETLKRVYLYSDSLEMVAFLINQDLVDKWTKMLIYVEDDRVSLRINCSEATVVELDEKPRVVNFASDAVLSLGHSAVGTPYPFQGAIQQIKIYPNADSTRLDSICSEEVPNIASSGESTDDYDFTDDLPPPAEKGEKGDKGDSIVGPQGPQGPPGPTGPIGLPGQKGTCECSASKISEMIAKSLPELKGAPGAIGPPGADGKPGVQGPEGNRGPPGDKGDRGTKGKEGTPGIKGEPGTNGIPGPIGPPGTACKATELKGLKGERGEPGIPGKNGANGEKGDKGPPGSPGNFSSIFVSETNPNDLQTFANKLKKYLEIKNHEKISTIIGPQGLKGQKGDVGPKGASGSRGPKGAKCTITKSELQKLKGEKGDRGEIGPMGPPGPPSQPQDNLGTPGPPGPPGPMGPRGSPGLSIVGPKGEPGKVSVSSIYEESIVDENHDDYVYVTETVVFKSTTALFRRKQNTPTGTLAFVRKSKTLLLRVEEGWQHVMLGSLIDENSFHTLPNKKQDLPIKRESMKLQQTAEPKNKIDLSNGFIRIAALNTPFQGNLLNHFNESRFTHSECQPQALRAGVRDGPFLPFLAEREPINYLRGKVLKRLQKYPVVNLKHEVLFDSYESMFDGTGAEMEANHPPIYSFDGKNVFMHPDWPIKAIWHGSDPFGNHQPGIDCESFQSNSSDVFGMGSPLVWNKLLAQEWYSCEKKLIVLCVDYNATRRKKRHLRRKSSVRYDVDSDGGLSNVTNL